MTVIIFCSIQLQKFLLQQKSINQIKFIFKSFYLHFMFKNHYHNSSLCSKNVPIFVILFSFVLALVFLLIYYSDQFSTFKQAIIILILIGYVYIICRNAEGIFHGYSSKTFKLSELNNDESFYAHQKNQDNGMSQFKKQLTNINTEMEIMERENQICDQSSLIRKSYYKSKKSQQRYLGSFSLNTIRQFNSDYSENIQNVSIIEEIRNKIKPKNIGASYKRLSNGSSYNSKYYVKLSKSNASVFNAVGLSQDKIDICIQIVQDYLNDSLDSVLSRYEFNYKELSKLISNCFGLKLTVNQQYHRQERQTISLSELQILIQTVKRQKCLPKFYKCLIKVQELASYITSIQVIFNRIPNLKVPSSHLALQVYVQILKNQFSSQSIKLVEDKISVFLYQSNPNSNYFVKNKDGTIGYTKFIDFRTKDAKQIVLLYMINIARTEYKCQKRVIKQLKNYIAKTNEKQKSSSKK